jgi:hypothetical protein
MIKEGTHASHIPTATAAALPPELPPGDLSSWLKEFSGERLKGFLTGPCIE